MNFLNNLWEREIRIDRLIRPYLQKQTRYGDEHILRASAGSRERLNEEEKK